MKKVNVTKPSGTVTIEVMDFIHLLRESKTVVVITTTDGSEFHGTISYYTRDNETNTISTITLKYLDKEEITVFHSIFGKEIKTFQVAL